MPVTTQRSTHPYSDTLTMLERAIRNGGGTVFAVIDQAAAATSAGLALRPTSLILFGNPKGGTPLMDAFPLVALELPLKLLVWEERGEVTIGYTPLRETAARYGVNGMDARIEAIDRATDDLIASVLAR
jgi:uncharacterized protein (DUF302 family)